MRRGLWARKGDTLTKGWGKWGAFFFGFSQETRKEFWWVFVFFLPFSLKPLKFVYRQQRKGRTKQIISTNKERKRNEEAFSHGSECGVLLYGNGGKWRLRGQAALFWVLAPFLFSVSVFLRQFELPNLGRRRLNFGPPMTTVRGYLNLMKDYGLGSEVIMWASILWP